MATRPRVVNTLPDAQVSVSLMKGLRMGFVVKITLSLLMVLLVTSVASATTVTGLVFEDRNENGIRDRGEPGIKNVSVSNQIDVVLTNRSGYYELPAFDEMVVFVTQPVGYRVPVNDVNLPQFFYVHDPNGSSSDINWRFEGVPPTAELPESVDFPLIKYKHPNPFRMIAMADPQPRNEREIDFIRDDVIAQMIGKEAELAIIHGDIMFDDLALFDRQNRIFATLGMPVWNVPGNHDINVASPDDAQSLETYKRIFGPTYYSHNYADVHFMTLKNVHYKGYDYSVAPGKSGRRGYTGFIGEDQIEWIENDLKYVPKDKLIVISTHIPFKAFQGDGDRTNTTNREEVFKLLEGRNYILLLAGHTHTNDHVYIHHDHGWHGEKPIHQHVLATVSGSWWSGPLDERGIPAATMRDGGENGYHIFTFDENEYSSRFIPASMDEDYQIRVTLDTEYRNDKFHALVYEMRGEQGNVIRAEQIFGTKVVANVFSAGEKAQVSVQFDNGDPVMMVHTIRYDPFFTESRERLKEQKAANELNYWSEDLSSHIWEARLPNDLQPGSHVIHVTAIDQFGQTLEGQKIFEIVAP
jgi:3',5'-cyclic AMP phosphodiesterase CpdA